MSRIYNHSPNAEDIANRVRLVLLLAMAIIIFVFVANMDELQSKQFEQQDYVQTLEQGEYEATLTVSTENGRLTIPVTFIVENDGKFGTVKLNANKNVETAE